MGFKVQKMQKMRHFKRKMLGYSLAGMDGGPIFATDLLASEFVS